MTSNADGGHVAPLDAGLVETYHTDGYIHLDNALPVGVVDEIRAELPALLDDQTGGRVVEDDGSTVRSVYGAHQSVDAAARLCRDPVLLSAAGQLLDTDALYVHQFKVNAKEAFDGGVWDWHQDFVYWHVDDKVPAPLLVNCVVFLDEVTEFNAPLTVIPGSHATGILQSDARFEMPGGYEEAPGWVANLTAEERFGLPRSLITDLANRFGLAALKGSPGSVAFFHPNLVHASPPNISPFGRPLAIIVYNRVDNAPPAAADRRPDFLAARSFAPLEALERHRP